MLKPFAAALLVLSLSACATAPATRPEAAETPTALSAEAQQALARAEADIARARSEFALWVPAEDALNRARAAAEAGDSAEVLRQSRLASEFAALGLAQRHGPTTERP